MQDSTQLNEPQLRSQAKRQIRLADAKATQQLGQVLGQFLVQLAQISCDARAEPASFVLLLSGNLGSGKTTFVQGLGLGLGILDDIVSPTFTLVCEYPEAELPLYHFDLYRLQPPEVEEMAPDTYWDGNEYPPGVVAIEWAERLPYLPAEYLSIELLDPEVELEVDPEESVGLAEPGRLANLQAVGQAPQQLLLALEPALASALGQ
ncbi:MAG: tRNA (adenosine(37)-N6)-threonylcarbamoyltransferase complex ATPase subunit type 1 TsaE [Elainella sp.]